MLYDPKWEKQAETAPVEKWRKLLLDAADAIETHGHAKGALVRPSGAMCLLGALNFAESGNAENLSWGDGYMNAWRKLTALCGDNVADFNNAPERTKEEVIAVLRQAALAASA